MNPFKELGLPDTASAQEVKARWRQLASQHHPDRGGSAETFAKLSRAFQAAIRVVTTRESRCPRCHGHGRITLRSGFSSLKLTCPECRGSGELPSNLKEQAE